MITCPVCGIPVRAIADLALLDEEGVRVEIERYRNEYLRAACSDHAWPGARVLGGHREPHALGAPRNAGKWRNWQTRMP